MLSSILYLQKIYYLLIDASAAFMNRTERIIIYK
jgi:hypothetical protein